MTITQGGLIKMNEGNISVRQTAPVSTLFKSLLLLQVVGAMATALTGAMSTTGFFFRVLEMQGVNIPFTELLRDHYGSLLLATAFLLAFLLLNKYVLLRMKNNRTAAAS